MSIITSHPLNGDQVMAGLPQGSSFNSFGGALDSTEQKELVPVGTDDATLQAAVNAAAQAYVDYNTNTQTLLQKATTALQNNQNYLALSTPTNAQAVAQVSALTRQMDALIRVVTDLATSTSGT